MAMGDDQRMRLCQGFLRDAPPGEFNEVFNGEDAVGL